MVVFIYTVCRGTRGGAIKRENFTSLLPGPGKNLQPMSTKKALYSTQKDTVCSPVALKGEQKVAENSCLDQAIWVLKYVVLE